MTPCSIRPRSNWACQHELRRAHSVRLLLHITAWRVFDRGMAAIPALVWRGNCAGGVALHPAVPVRPPASGFLRGLFKPVHRLAGEIVMGPVAALVARRRIDDPGDVTAGGEHKTRILPDQPFREIGALP